MSVRTDQINLNVVINGDKAKKELGDLRKRSADLRSEMQGLSKSSQEYAQKSAELTSVTQRMGALKKEIGLTALSQKELVNELRRLNAIKGSLTPQTKEFKDLQKQIDAVNSRLKQVKTGMFGFRGVIANMKDEVKQFGMLAAGYLGFGFITSQLQNMVAGSAKYADALTGIQKSSGLTEKETEKLAQSLKRIDTRTPNSQLRELAIAAGKIGKRSTEDILAFVRAANKLQIALGDDLQGSAEDIARALGKVSQVFHVEELYGTEDALNKIGSAMNELAQSGNISATFLLDFTKRLGGIAPITGVSVDQILGLGAALDEMGQTSEVSSTALSKLFTEMAKKSGTFAKYAGMQVQDFQKLMKTDFMSAFLKVLDGIKGSSANINELADTLGKLGLDGGRVVGILGALANNTDLVREKMELSNKAFVQGTSLTNEAALRENNFAGEVARLGKAFDQLLTSKAVLGFIHGLVDALSGLVKWIPQAIIWTKEHLTTIIAWSSSIFILNGGLQALAAKLITFATGIKSVSAALTISTFLTKVQVAAQLAWGVVSAAMTLNIKKLREAWVAFNVVLKLNPWTFLLAALAATIGAMALLFSNTQILTAEMKAENEIQSRTEQATIKKKLAVQNLVDAIRNGNLTYTENKKLLKELIALDPEYLKGLNLANIYTAEGTKILDDYIVKLEERAKAEALQQYQVEIEKKRIDLLQKRNEAYDYEMALFGNHPEDKTLIEKLKRAGNQWTEAAKVMIPGMKSVGEKVADYTDQLDGLNKQSAFIKKQIQNSIKNGSLKIKPDDDGGGGGGGGKGTQDDALKKLQEIQAQMDALHQEVLKKQAEFNKDQKALDDGEIAAIKEKYEKLLQEAVKYHAAATKIDQLKADEKTEVGITKSRFQQRDDENGYEQSLNSLRLYYDRQKQISDESFLNGETTTEQHETQLKQIESEALTSRIQAAEYWAEFVKKAAEDAEKGKTEQLKEGVAERTAILKKEEEDKEAFEKTDFSVSSLSGKSMSDLNALQERLKTEHDLKVAAAEQTGADVNAINEEYQQKSTQIFVAKMAKAFAVVSQLGGMANQALSGFLSALSAKQDAELENYRADNEEKQTLLDDRLQKGLISQKQHDQQLNNLKNQLDQREKEARLKQAKAQKASSIFSAIINTAAGVAQALGSLPPPLSYIMAAISAAMGAAQIAMIASTPLPKGKQGLIVQGPGHEDGGINMINNRTGQPIAEIEGGEPVMVLSKNTYGNNKGLIDQLLFNSNYRNGAKVQPKWLYNTPTPINVGGAIKAMKSGGIAGALSPDGIKAIESGNEDNGRWLRQISLDINALRTETQQQKQKLRAVVSLQEFEEKQQLRDRAKGLAGLH